MTIPEPTPEPDVPADFPDLTPIPPDDTEIPAPELEVDIYDDGSYGDTPDQTEEVADE